MNRRPGRRPPRLNPGRHRLRIIGGRWRGRRFPFPAAEGLRPTPDRVRETVFNWLQPIIEGARCLDLFAGSGALGLEALSRGAREVVMVDRAATVVGSLRTHLEALQGSARIVQANALDYLQGPAEPFDVVFLDPPYAKGLVGPACSLLERGGWLAPGALVYFETEQCAPADFPIGWDIHREKIAGQVRYGLIRIP